MELPTEKRKIILEMFKSNEKLSIIVRNSSIQKEFDPTFFKLGSSTKMKNGQGFGLAIIQEIIKKYQASLNTTTDEDLISFIIQISRQENSNTNNY